MWRAGGAALARLNTLRGVLVLNSLSQIGYLLISRGICLCDVIGIIYSASNSKSSLSRRVSFWFKLPSLPFSLGGEPGYDMKGERESVLSHYMFLVFIFR